MLPRAEVHMLFQLVLRNGHDRSLRWGVTITGGDCHGLWPRSDGVDVGWGRWCAWVVIRAGRRGQCRTPYGWYVRIVPLRRGAVVGLDCAAEQSMPVPYIGVVRYRACGFTRPL